MINSIDRETTTAEPPAIYIVRTVFAVITIQTILARLTDRATSVIIDVLSMLRTIAGDKYMVQLSDSIEFTVGGPKQIRG